MDKELSELLKGLIREYKSLWKVVEIKECKTCSCNSLREKQRKAILYDSTEYEEIMQKIYEIYGFGWIAIVNDKESYIGKTLEEIREKSKRPLTEIKYLEQIKNFNAFKL